MLNISSSDHSAANQAKQANPANQSHETKKSGGTGSEVPVTIVHLVRHGEVLTGQDPVWPDSWLSFVFPWPLYGCPHCAIFRRS